MPSTYTATLRMSSFLLQQLAQPAVCQGLPAGLTGRAVLQARVGEGDLAHRVAADRARLTGAAVDGELRLLLGLELAGGQSAGPFDRVAQRVLDRREQRRVLALAQAVGRLERA